jgi:hypothetical protein
VREVTANKLYYDLLYGWLQEHSYLDYNAMGPARYIDKSSIKFVDLAEDFGMSRQSVSAKFKNLIDFGLVEFLERENRYIIHTLANSDASLIPFETLKLLTDALSHNCISIYVYLLNRYIANNEKSFMATFEQLKGFIGLSTKSSSNNSTISNILVVLKRIGLIDYKLEFFDDKTHLIIEWVTNKVC